MHILVIPGIAWKFFVKRNFADAISKNMLIKNDYFSAVLPPNYVFDLNQDMYALKILTCANFIMIVNQIKL